MNRLDRADIQPLGWLHSHHTFRLGRNLARQDHSLEVAARKQSRLDIHRWRANLVGILQPVGKRAGFGCIKPQAAAERRLVYEAYGALGGERAVDELARRMTRRAASRLSSPPAPAETSTWLGPLVPCRIEVCPTLAA